MLGLCFRWFWEMLRCRVGVIFVVGLDWEVGFVSI